MSAGEIDGRREGPLSRTQMLLPRNGPIREEKASQETKCLSPFLLDGARPVGEPSQLAPFARPFVPKARGYLSIRVRFSLVREKNGGPATIRFRFPRFVAWIPSREEREPVLSRKYVPDSDSTPNSWFASALKKWLFFRITSSPTSLSTT